MQKIKFTIETELQHYEICDASGAIAIGEQHFAVANDEDNILRIYEADSSGKPVDYVDINDYFHNNPKRREVDLEDSTELNGVIYWISSHGRNRKGKSKPERHQFFANKLENTDEMTFEQVGHSYTRLVRKDMAKAKQLKKYHLKKAKKLAPKAKGGLNIEGLSIASDQELLIGFRNPVPKGKALLLPLKNPGDLVEKKGARAVFGKPIELDLNGLGIRSIVYWELKQQYIIVAGAYDGSEQFALYHWLGLHEAPRLIEELDLPSDFHPEGILFYPNQDSRFQLISDDGALKRNGDTPCKDIKNKDNSQKYFRSLWIRADAEDE